ncbi:MAG: PEP-CTERM sorting domain-containing protein, partial [Verrucomicrobia bacterium]|nr:PEP-CTERM sorting domain-containing protein [Verrucomicrobiota bacterium]
NTLVATAAGIGDPASVISMWYVDALSTCSTTENVPGIAGCAGGNVNVVESPIAAGGFGAELIAHEFGHNLGLGHTPDALAPAGNLMDPTLNANTTLTAAQQNAMLLDSKVQTDGGGRFVQIRPIIVAATPVPEPSTAALISLSGLLLLGRRWR